MSQTNPKSFRSRLALARETMQDIHLGFVAFTGDIFLLLGSFAAAFSLTGKDKYLLLAAGALLGFGFIFLWAQDRPRLQKLAYYWGLLQSLLFAPLIVQADSFKQGLVLVLTLIGYLFLFWLLRKHWSGPHQP